jgi:hypothetical protein
VVRGKQITFRPMLVVFNPSVIADGDKSLATILHPPFRNINIIDITISGSDKIKN